MGFSKKVSDQALRASGRNCCLCKRFCGTNIETHHIIPSAEGGDNSFDNCIPLCFGCHAIVGGYNPQHPMGRKMQPDELKWMRDQLYEQVASGTFVPVADISGNTMGNIDIRGNGNIVAGGNVNVNPKIVNKTTVQYDPALHISSETAKRIYDLVDSLSKIRIAAGDDPKKTKPRIWSSLNNRYKVTTYKIIPRESGEDAITFLYKQVNIARPSIRKCDPQLWKSTLYKSIYTRWSELGFNKDDIYSFALKNIPLKNPITSLTKLTMRELDRLNIVLLNLQKRLNS